MKMDFLEQVANLKQFAHSSKEAAYTHPIYSYPAKFTSYLPRELIKSFSNRNDLVCDPFSGGGTVGLESMLLDRRFIGYDINYFAIFLSKVKTTYVSSYTLEESFETLLRQYRGELEFKIDILDQVDKKCLGKKISQEINRLNYCIHSVFKKAEIQNFFKLALIHSIKIIGRRDFEQRKNWKKASILPTFGHKVLKMIKKVSSLPETVNIKPEFKVGSNHQMNIANNEVDLIITSPPYFDVDIEYQLIQLQRPSLNKSKRSNVINQILGVENQTKSDLCWSGKSGSKYWENLYKSLAEIHRILKNGKLLCLWTGFKTAEGKSRLIELIGETNFKLKSKLDVKLSNNRAASSRSTHHMRKTGLLRNDSIYFLTKDD